jgi:Domain of unknown function (DUF1905)
VSPVGSITLTAELVARGPAAAFVLDDEQVAIVGEGAKRFPARATINGTVLRTTVTKMRGEYLFGLSRAAREQAGIAATDTVTFTLELDTEPRTVEVPRRAGSGARRRPAGPGGVRRARPHPPQGIRAVGDGGQARGDT